MNSSGPARQDAADPLDGRYVLGPLLGEGGYARVHRATDTALGRDVAIKLFQVDTPDGTDSRRIDSETRLLATLNHPSLVTLFDARLDATPAYLVMELIEGPTLREVLSDAPLPPRAVAELAVHLGEALQVIHGAGVVHRDIKPSNVLLRRSPITGAPDRATLADFGIASLVDTTRVTAAGTLVGTAAYLSPEQARGERPAPPTDVYSLGLVLLEALTGSRAFPQSTPQEALVARLVRSPEIPASLPPDWRSVLSAMTALDPAHRPDAHAVVRAATRLLNDDGATRAAALSPTRPLPDPPTAVLPPADEDPAPSPHRVGRIWWALGASVLLLGLLAVFVVPAVIPAPSAEPTLPALPDPLGPRFEDLWRQLTP